MADVTTQEVRELRSAVQALVQLNSETILLLRGVAQKAGIDSRRLGEMMSSLAPNVLDQAVRGTWDYEAHRTTLPLV